MIAHADCSRNDPFGRPSQGGAYIALPLSGLMQPIRLCVLVVIFLMPQVALAQNVSDRLRECALAVRVAMPAIERGAAPSPQLQGEAQTKVHQFQAAMSEAEFDECLLLAWVGFDHGFVPVTYSLDPGRWIELTVRGATIVNQGKSTLFKWGFPREGARFLPSRHSEIATDGPDGRRHFIELFVWTPSQPRRDMWQLMWYAWEIVDSELSQVAGERLLSMTTPPPPNASSLDVFSMAAIRLNDAGQVEWRVARGADAQQEVIVSPSEKRARAAAYEQQAQRRKTADDKVDWNRVGDIRRRASLTYSDADGCGLAFVYGWSDDRMEAITVEADAELLRLSAKPQTFDIARQPSTLKVAVHVYGRPVRSLQFCTDVILLPGPAEEPWRAIAGRITIEMVPITDISGAPRQRATLRLTDAIFENAEGARVTQTQPIVMTAIVGWFNG